MSSEGSSWICYYTGILSWNTRNTHIMTGIGGFAEDDGIFIAIYMQMMKSENEKIINKIIFTLKFIDSKRLYSFRDSECLNWKLPILNSRG